MKIIRIEAIPFRLPVRRDFRWAGLAADLGSFVLVRVFTDDGLVGLGEATPLPDWGGDHDRRSGETLKTVCDVIDDVLAPALVSLDPIAIEFVRLRMARALKGNGYAKNAIEMALYDIAGKAAGMPLYKLLGGGERTAVPVAHMVGLMPNDEALPEALGAVEDGIHHLQIKGGVDPARDIDLVRGIRDAAGPDLVLRVDANQGYGDPKAAISIIRHLEDAGVNFIEQPSAGLREMGRIRAGVSVPIIADESCWDAHDALDVIASGAADHISIYLAKAAGISGARRVAALAETGGCRCDVNGSIESAIGNAANLAFALATPVVDLGSVVPISAPAGTHPYTIAGHYYEDDIALEPFSASDGALLPLDGPGLGVILDEAKLEKYRI